MDKITIIGCKLQVTCAGLDGLKFCIQQFIHPDQILLLHGSPESTFKNLADVLQQCTVSVHWEIRDSAMEVVLEMAKLSHVSKFNRHPLLVLLIIFKMIASLIFLFLRISRIPKLAYKFAFTGSCFVSI